MSLIAGLLLAVVVCQGDLEQVRSYANRHASDAVAGAESFVDTHLVKGWINRHLTPEDRRHVAALRASTLVETDGRFVFTSLCREHQCPCDNVTVAVDAHTGAVFVGFWKGSARWISAGKRSSIAPAELPCPVIGHFHFGHVPRMDASDAWCDRKEPPLPATGVVGALSKVCE